MGLDRSLDEEGIPDLEGPLPGKAATGDPQEGVAPPTDRPAAADYGVTADEQSRPEPLDDRLARELPDVPSASESDQPLLVAPDDDVDGELIATGVDPGLSGTSAEEAAVHVVEER